MTAPDFKDQWYTCILLSDSDKKFILMRIISKQQESVLIKSNLSFIPVCPTFKYVFFYMMYFNNVYSLSINIFEQDDSSISISMNNF